jgi:hypothetical protein
VDAIRKSAHIADWRMTSSGISVEEMACHRFTEGVKRARVEMESAQLASCPRESARQSHCQSPVLRFMALHYHAFGIMPGN